jgi:hypothetical protein
LSSLTAAAISRAVADVDLFPLLRLFICCSFGLRIAKSHFLLPTGLSHERLDSRMAIRKVTGDDAATAALQKSAIAVIVNAARVTATVQYHVVIALWRAKTVECVG